MYIYSINNLAETLAWSSFNIPIISSFKMRFFILFNLRHCGTNPIDFILKSLKVWISLWVCVLHFQGTRHSITTDSFGVFKIKQEIISSVCLVTVYPFYRFLADFPNFLTHFPNFLTDFPNFLSDFPNFLNWLS